MPHDQEQSEALLAAHVDGTLPSERRRMVERALAAKPDRRRAVDEMRRVKAWAATLPREPAPAGLCTPVAERLERADLLAGDVRLTAGRASRQPAVLIGLLLAGGVAAGAAFWFGPPGRDPALVTPTDPPAPPASDPAVPAAPNARPPLPPPAAPATADGPEPVAAPDESPSETFAAGDLVLVTVDGRPRVGVVAADGRLLASGLPPVRAAGLTPPLLAEVVRFELDSAASVVAAPASPPQPAP